MNIFYLDENVERCAVYHNDKHVVKMILEYTQLLSTAHRILDVIPNDEGGPLYRATHVNHPSAKWVRQSRTHYEWLYSLLVELCKEYTYRYVRVHKVEASGLLFILSIPPQNIPDIPFSPPPPAMPEEYKNANALLAYRTYYKFGKSHIAHWKNRQTPHFMLS